MEIKLFDSIDQAKKTLRPNQLRLMKYGNKNFCVILDGDSLKVFENECPHMGHPLHQGNINYLGEIVCPLHTYRFSLRTGEETEKRCRSLRFYEVKIDGEVSIVV